MGAEAVPHLTDILLSEGVPTIDKAYAAQVCAGLGDHRCVSALFRAMRIPRDETIDLSAAKALEKITGVPACVYLLDVAEDGKLPPGTRRRAIYHVGTVGDAAAVPRLEALRNSQPLEDYDNPEVLRICAGHALAAIRLKTAARAADSKPGSSASHGTNRGEHAEGPRRNVTDAFGRPLPWGPEAGGQRISLRTAITGLKYGQPVQMCLEHVNPSGEPPMLRFEYGEHRYYRVVVTTAEGAPVDCLSRVRAGGHGSDGSCLILRIDPRGGSALGRYFRPGKYRARVIYESNRDPGDGIRWVGKLTSNAADFTVAGPTDSLRESVPEDLQATVAPLIAALDAREYAARCKASHALAAFQRTEAIPLLGEVVRSGSAEAREKAELLIWQKLAPAVWGTLQRNPRVARQEIGPVLGWLGEAVLKAVCERAKWSRPQELIVFSVLNAPLGPHRDMTELDEPGAAQVVAALGSKDPLGRLRAVRSLSRTGNEQVLKALAGLLDDPYSYYPSGTICSPTPCYAVAEAAAACLTWQGPAAVGTVADQYRRLRAMGPAKEWSAYRCISLFGQLGPDPRSLSLLEECVDGDVESSRNAAVDALKYLGPGAVPTMLRIAAKKEQRPHVVDSMIRMACQYGTDRQIGTLLEEHLGSGTYPVAAARAAQRLNRKDLLPDIERLASSGDTDAQARVELAGVMAALGGGAKAAQILMGLLAPEPEGSAAGMTGLQLARISSVRGKAALELARIEYRPAIPRILDALEDRNWYVRATADHALRSFANAPGGVGYQPHADSLDEAVLRAKSAGWREWFKEHAK
jgi:HEAT repeat protein